MHIAIDVDGVLRRLIPSIRREFLKDYPEEEPNIEPASSLDAWGVEKLAKTEQLGQRLRDFAFANPETSFRCFRNADPIDGAPQAIGSFYKDLKGRDHVLSICTSQPNAWQRQATLEWLHDNFIALDNVIMTGTGKGHFGLDYLFDDRIKNCAAVEQNGGTGVLRNRTYNREGRDQISQTADSVSEYKSIVLS